mmetsp:Transcript_34024/g.106595  ORF Transcript_34024/g.106595 Transcript_34024/m.106595 type:complete len:392 (-) Transcript_34024:43-1218(-)
MLGLRMYQRVDEVPPIHSWGSDPLWNTMVPVTASMVHSAYSRMVTKHGLVCAADGELPARRGSEGVGIMVVGRNRVISRVRLLGDVVAVKDRDNFVEFKLDDSSDIITCILWKSDAMKPGLGYEGVKLGKHLHVGGKLSQYRGEVQLSVWFASIEENVDAMSYFWVKMVDLHLNHYSKANTLCNEIPDLATDLEQPQVRSKRGKFSSSELGQQRSAACDEMEEALLVVETPAMKLDEAIKKFASSYSCDNCIFSFERVLQDHEVVRAASALQFNPPKASPNFEAFRVRASVAHSIARLRKDGWIALCDQEQDLYTYVGTTKEVAKTLLQYLKKLASFDSPLSIALHEIIQGVQDHPSLRFVGHRSIESALSLLVLESSITKEGVSRYVIAA